MTDAYSAAAGEMPAESRNAVESFLSGSMPPDHYTAVLCHNDLGAEHLLVEPATW